MSDQIKPALSAVEWADYLAPTEHWMAKRGGHRNEADHHIAIAQLDGGMSRPALAALALYGQPVGFTPEEVVAVRESAEDDHAAYCHSATLRIVAQKLAALLPESP